MKQQVIRFLFGPFWFFLLPLGTSILVVSLLSLEPNSLPSGGIDYVRYWIGGQKVPAIILFFIVFEMLLYRLRFTLPLADELTSLSSHGLPKEKRILFENAHQLLQESARLLKKKNAQIEKNLSAKQRERLESKLKELDDLMSAKPIDLQAFESCYEQASELADKDLAPFRRGETREIIETLLTALAVAIMVRAFVVEAFKIPTGSMLPTLQIQDHIFVNKFSYGPKLPWIGRIFSDVPPERADIAVFVNPDAPPGTTPDDYIKRVIAHPGDIFEVKGGFPVINGFEVPHCRVGDYDYIDHRTGYTISSELFIEFLGDRAYLIQFRGGRHEEDYAKYNVKEGEFWVLGDNRNNSRDSRFWNHGRGGGVPFDNVKGKALFVWLSFNDNAGDFLGVTWDRLFTNVMGTPRLPLEAPQNLKDKIQQCLASAPKNTTPPAAPSH